MSDLKDAVIISAVRTPTGKFQGALKPFSATDLGAIAIREAVKRAGINAADVDEVIMGCVVQAGLGQAPARQAALKADLPPEVSALTVNMVCGSGLRAVSLAAQAIKLGDAASETARKPEPQTIFTVKAETSGGKSALSAACRAGA